MLAEKLRAAAGSADPSWDLANAVYQGSPVNFLYVGTQETSPQDVFFKPDGLKMYVIGNVGDDVNEYDLSTAWDVTTAVFLQSKSISAQEGFPTGLFFKPDGLKMYVIGINNDRVNEYNLSTAWDVSTASYLQNFSVTAQEAAPNGLFFKPDGLKMYVIGASSDNVYEYTLSTAWNVSTAVFLQSKSISAQETAPQGLFFKPDGLKMYVIGSIADNVNEYTLSTAWNISTASYLRNFSVTAQETAPQGLFFKPDGLKMYVTGASSDNVYGYDLSTAWDVSTASFTYPTTDYFSVAAQEAAPQDVFFKPDGLKMYVTGSSGDDVNEYDLSTAWDISTASYLQNFSVAAQESQPLAVFFKPDGLKMYVMGSSGDDVNEYNLSTAWNISTASYLQNFYIGTKLPSGLFFKPDGLKMYVTESSGDDINEYNLSTAWDVTTAVLLQSKSVIAQDDTTTGIFFKPDGLKMYVIGAEALNVYEYTLSTAWDISTASYLQNFSVSVQEISPSGVFFKPDGLKMYVIGASSDTIWSYDFV